MIFRSVSRLRMGLLARCIAACAAVVVCAPAQQPYVTSAPAFPPSVERSLGVAAAFAGDVNGDGAPDLVTGSPYSRFDQSDAFTDRIPFSGFGGVAGFQVWTPSTGAIVRTVTIPLPSSSGYAIVDLGDIDGDGIRDHAVSDPTITSAGGPTSSGRVDAISGATGLVLWPWTGSPAGANTGVSMARIADVDGDGTRDLLVGAPAGVGIAGRVFVLSARTGTLLRTHVGILGDNLGFGTADAGDVDGDGIADYAAGAPQAAAPGGALLAGYVRLWSGATGAVIRTVTGPVSADRFGRALATAGDLDGDAIPDLYVGAPARHAATVPGRVYAISGATGATVFSATRGVAGDRYGWALAAVGDRNADGRIDCAAGTTAGVVEIISGASGAVLATQTGIGGPGTSLAGIDMRPITVGDLDGNGTIDLAIGSSAGAENGLLQVYGTFFAAPVASLCGNDGQSVISSVSALGDLDGDGLRDLAIANRRANTQAIPDAGSVLIWSLGAAAPIAQLFGTVALSYFGASICTLDDVDGDGVEDFLVGSLAGAGTVTCYSGATRAVLYSIGGIAAGDAFGYSLARLSDVDGDGKRDFAAGSPYAAVAGTATTGRVRICSGANGATIASAAGSGLEFFGATIAQTGDVDGDGSGDLVVGGPYSSAGGIAFGGVARIVSVRNGTILRTHFGMSSGIALGGGVCGIRDADFDGVGDYVIASPANTASGAATAGPVVIRSGATGAVIRAIAPTPVPPGFSVNDTFGFGLADAGDIDGDGGDDLVLGVQPWLGVPPAQAREVHVYSVATGALVSRQVAAAGYTPGSPAVNAAGFDLSGDGVPDWAILPNPGAVPPSTLTVLVVSHAGVPVGSTSAGIGCNVLGGPAPVLQAMGGAPIAATGAPAFGVLLSRALPFQWGIGTLGASNTSSAGTPLPLNLAVIGAPGCFLYNSADVLIPFYATADGRHGFPVPIPAVPSLAGATAHVQAFLFGGPSLVAASNGLTIVVQ